jgi:2-methylisocitrate lyase-like PEP mutase family enzyme
MVTGLVSRMTAAVPAPVSIDLEAGYGDTPEAAAKSVTGILKAGAIGIISKCADQRRRPLCSWAEGKA